MSRQGDEDRLYGVVSGALRRWLDRARDVVMAPWTQYRIQPDPTAIYQLQGNWDDEVDTILGTISQIALGAWSNATDVPPVSRHAFVMAYLADVRSLLVRIPDEVENLIFAEIVDGTNVGESLDQLAARIDRVLSYTGSERWPGRARTIARTETTRAYGAGTMAAGLEQSRVTGRVLTKRWEAHEDELTVRPWHRGADGDVVPIYMPFQVGPDQLQFPADPTGLPSNVINCRCRLIIENEEGR